MKNVLGIGRIDYSMLSASATFFKKKLSTELNRYILLSCFMLPISLLFFVAVLVEGVPEIKSGFYVGLLGAGLLVICKLASHTWKEQKGNYKKKSFMMEDFQK